MKPSLVRAGSSSRTPYLRILWQMTSPAWTSASSSSSSKPQTTFPRYACCGWKEQTRCRTRVCPLTSSASWSASLNKTSGTTSKQYSSAPWQSTQLSPSREPSMSANRSLGRQREPQSSRSRKNLSLPQRSRRELKRTSFGSKKTPLLTTTSTARKSLESVVSPRCTRCCARQTRNSLL